ncbi:unnamed protein product, partial [marine sediment metagenome]
IECFKCHPSGYSPITNNSHYMVIIVGKVAGNSHAQGSRNRGASVTGAKRVMLTLAAAGKTGQPSILWF